MPQIAGFRGVLSQDVSKAGAIEIGKALAAGTLTRDASRAVYRYHQVFALSGGRSFVRKSLVCAIRLAPWTERSVRPHEATVPAAREAALAAIRANGAHTQPVLAGFRTEDAFDAASSPRIEKEMADSEALARRLGVQGTPAFAAGRTGKDLSLLPVRSLDADGLTPFLDQLLTE